MSIDYLIVGHVTQDVTASGLLWGGTAFYAARTAQRLGRRVGLVTRVPAGLGLEEALPGVAMHLLPTDHPTTFENRYDGSARTQVVRHVAAPIEWEDVPAAWQRAPIVHLGPIAQDVAPTLLPHFSYSLLCVTPQGWMRGWDAEGRVHFVPLEHPEEVLRPVDVIVFSAEDVNHEPGAMQRLIRAVPLAVTTRAEQGSVVHTRDGARPVPARAARAIDPTGAGDVFAAAFFIRLYEHGDPYEAAAFANVVASLSIERAGAGGIPTRAEVEAWFAARRR